ncbi:MAG: xanthine dehydrogenase family protein molybdopterin-binding subunit [Terriglobia bacterium]
MNTTSKVTRRNFMKVGALAGTGLVIAFYLPSSHELNTSADSAGGSFAPNAFLQIEPDGKITVWVTKSEMGQGIQTSLPMLVAEELEADWATIHIKQADANPKYGDQGTGGSESIRTMWTPLRKAGATARTMLIAAAAQTWGVDKSTCKAKSGAVIHGPSGRKLAYGELAIKASKLPVPTTVSLKDPKDFTIIGKKQPRLDTREKVEGKAVFGLDVRVPGMLYATLAQCPVFGGKVVSFDAAKAKAIKGVRDVVKVRDGIAVIAENTWLAMEGRRALDIKWDEGPNTGVSSPTISRMFAEQSKQPGLVARSVGDAAKALASAPNILESLYEFPYLAHATMEPMNCTADARADRCEIWAPTQFPSWGQETAAHLLGLKPEKVTVHVTLLGGGFGRRANPDFMVQAAEISKAAGAPIMLVWTREDDMQHDFYRPTSSQLLRAGIDNKGFPVAWHHHILGPSIDAQMNPNFKGLDKGAVDVAASLPYAVPNIHVDFLNVSIPVPVGWWRSVWASQHAYANECFMDEIAFASRSDPYEFRMKLLANEPRYKAVLKLAATKAGWGKKLPEERGMGIAVAKSFGTYVAQVAEVTVEFKKVTVHRVVCAVDCGQYVNPDTIEAQMQSAIVMGLTAAWKGEITIDRGRVMQGNFNDYPVLRMDEMPVIEVYIVPSQEKPGGIGEPGLPPIAPAVSNAIFASIGKRIRRLPIRSTYPA